ncbi:MAG: hypothetical protein E6K68_11350 [Nitrospirae bacterium]|nr:MAG: hypothetical protein E6K68_11350 [Nitrospirota bacterium]
MAIAHQRGTALRKVAGWTFCLVLLNLLLPELGLATNGLNLIGSGGISSALAGADTAVALDFTTMNSNPAGLTELKGTHAGFAVSMLKAELRLQNSANAKDGENDPVVIPNAGLVQSIKGTPITMGIGFFTIGGTTSDFRDVTTAPALGGTVDKEGTQLRYYKLTPTIAYQVTKDLSVGVALAISYADVSLTIFPNTPSGPGFPFGFETTGKCNRANGLAFPPTSCGYDVGFTPKFGALYKVTDTVTVGVAYTMKTPITFDHGQITKNFGGVKSTFDYKAFGFKWADDVAVGVSYRPTPSLLIATKFQWINWDGAMNNVVVQLTNGSTSDSFVLNYNWRDQYVIAVGALYDVTDRFSVRGGYNFGNNPIPKTTLDPINANIVQHHIAAGLAYRFTPGLLLDIWSTYGVQEQRTFDSQLFGANTTLKVGGYEVGITLTYHN